jgi:hypothetical protein
LGSTAFVSIERGLIDHDQKLIPGIEVVATVRAPPAPVVIASSAHPASGPCTYPQPDLSEER